MGYVIDWAAGDWHTDPDGVPDALPSYWEGLTATPLVDGVQFDAPVTAVPEGAVPFVRWGVPLTVTSPVTEAIPLLTEINPVDAVLGDCLYEGNALLLSLEPTIWANGDLVVNPLTTDPTEVTNELVLLTTPIPEGSYLLLIAPGTVISSDVSTVFAHSTSVTDPTAVPVDPTPTFDCSHWAPDTGCLGDAWDAFTTEVQERALMLATSSLQMLTYYRVGTCPITIRPCPETPRCGCGWNPHIRDGLWYNDCPCRSQCRPLSEIDIPGPVGYIEALLIDGVEQDLWGGDWRLDNGHLLVWQGQGSSPIPETQNLNLPDTEPGTWSITYSRSYPVNTDARLAVALLAVEFANACVPAKRCKLPRGVTNVVRQGVTFSIEAGLFPGGLTGIDIVDAFILKWAPAGSPLRTATVFDPSKRGPRRTSAVPARGVL